MIDPLTGIGAAASVLSICDIRYKVVKKMIDLSQALGGLPSDLQSCKHLVDTILPTTQRFQQRLSPEQGGTTVPSVATASVEESSEAYSSTVQLSPTIFLVYSMVCIAPRS